MMFENFKLSQLEKYKVLAWDIDQTMIGNDHSDEFGRYILAHPEQTHMIVTHRCGGWEIDIEEDLYIWGHDPFLFSRFHSVKHVPFNICWDMRFSLPERIKENTLVYSTWKGKICLEIGAQALIDDNVEHCYPGCELHGIDFFYSHGLMK